MKSPAKRWITAIVCLLAANVIAMVALAVIASDGASKVVPGYTDKASP